MPEPRPATGAAAHTPPGSPSVAVPPRPPHHHLELVGLVAAGGVVGTLARYETTLWLGTAPSGLPTATVTVNLVGCFLLGLLLEALGRRGPESSRMQAARLTLGTGMLGGFTTFSSLAEELAQLVHTHAVGVAALYAVVSVVGGLIATVMGITFAAAHHRRSTTDLPDDPDDPDDPKKDPTAGDRVNLEAKNTESGGEGR